MHSTGWPKAGDKMRFLGENGYPIEREEALKVLEVGQVLTVESCNVGNFSHSIRFLEVAGYFNGVMFEMADSPPNTPQDSQTLTADERVTLAECPPGPFMFGGGHLGFKTEYSAVLGKDAGGGKVEYAMTNYPEAYCMDSGEFFWGGATTHDERAALLVTPVDVVAGTVMSPEVAQQIADYLAPRRSDIARSQTILGRLPEKRFPPRRPQSRTRLI